jgi:hypothetical protein
MQFANTSHGFLSTEIGFGSAERPIMVPAKALLPESGAGREWWDAVASGSIVLEEEVLELLLERTDEENK